MTPVHVCLDRVPRPATPHCRLCRSPLSVHQPELLGRHLGLRPFLHPEGRDAQCANGRLDSWDRGGRALHADVVGAGGATAPSRKHIAVFE